MLPSQDLFFPALYFTIYLTPGIYFWKTFKKKRKKWWFCLWVAVGRLDGLGIRWCYTAYCNMFKLFPAQDCADSERLESGHSCHLIITSVMRDSEYLWGCWKRNNNSAFRDFYNREVIAGSGKLAPVWNVRRLCTILIKSQEQLAISNSDSSF